jgi:MFS family permease
MPRTSWLRTFIGVVAAVFATFTAYGAAVPMIPRLVTQRLHGPPIAVGIAFAVTGMVALLFRPYGGQLAQRWGCRPVMLAGAVLALVVGCAYVPPLGMPGLMAARVIMGAGEALVFTAGSVWTVALAPDGRRGQVIGLYGLAMWSGWTAGPVFGEMLYRYGSYAAVWTAGIVLPAVGIGILLLLPSTGRTEGQVSRRLLPPASVLPGLCLGSGAFGYATVAGFGTMLLSSRGLHHGAVVMTAFGGAYVLVRLFTGRLPDRVGPARVIVASSTIEAAGLALVGLAPSWWVAALGALTAGAGFTLLYPALALITMDRAPEAERGAALGAVISFHDLAVGVAGLVCGAVAEVSYPAPFFLAALVVLGSLVAGTAAVRGRARLAL